MEATSRLTLGFSPCPNDTFIFDAMVNGKINTEGLQFDIVMEDVESLNRKALNGELDIIKISYAVYPEIMNEYVLLNSGSALGFGVGPLLVSKEIRKKSEIKNLKIAIPGTHTTANFLFSIFFPEAKNKIEMIFSDIEDAVLSEKVDAGLLIHENRFTYEQRGLKKIYDLGELWEKETATAIPLGGIVVKRNLTVEVKREINCVLKRSIEYAFAHPDSSNSYVKQHAQKMDEEVLNKHIALYVNEFSIDLGSKGKDAIEKLFQKAKQSGMIQEIRDDIFIEESYLNQTLTF
jgi:1,4-dihydroxy-6-naphthoate synthase